MNKMIKSVVFLAAISFIAAPSWAEENAKKEENLNLKCIQYKQADSKDEKGTVYLKCIPAKKSSVHEYHDKTSNPYD